MKMISAICWVLSGAATASAQMHPSEQALPSAEEAVSADQPGRGAAERVRAPASAYEICMDASGGVTSEMLGCIDAEIVVRDDRLNETWGLMRRHLGEPEMAALRDAQRAWIAFRDARCGAELVLAGGGSLSSVVYADCILAMTIERTSDLNRTLRATVPDAGLDGSQR